MQSEKSRRIIFYSWQSDLPNASNRGFIEDALNLAAKAIYGDDSLKVEPVIDRDIAGIPGAPDIDLAILKKIREADIVVCDVSIINQGHKSRPSPNPNVLIECGYALKALGWERLILVMNTNYGGPKENLPFDLSRKHVVTYEMPKEQTDRATERKMLAKKLEVKCREIFTHIETEKSESSTKEEPTILDATIGVLEDQGANRIIFLKRYLEIMYDELLQIAPDLRADDSKKLLLDAIEQARGIVYGFARVVESAVMMNDSSAIEKIYDSFSKIACKYYLPKGFAGEYSRAQFDFFRFMGHELFVTFISFLLREDKWEDISRLLDKDIYVDNVDFVDSNITSYEYLSKNVRHFKYIEHSEILNKLHDEPEFCEADYLLYLKSDLSDTWPDWMPWSFLGLKHVPRFIASATRVSYSIHLQKLFNISIDKLKIMLQERYVFLAKIYMDATESRLWMVQSYFDSFDYGSIGTR